MAAATTRSLFSLPPREFQWRPKDGKLVSADGGSEVEFGRWRGVVCSVLYKFGYFKDLTLGSDQDDQQEESSGSSWIAAFASVLLSPLLITFYAAKSVLGGLLSFFAWPPRDFQWKRSREGRYFRVGTRRSGRLRGVAPDTLELPATSRRGRTRPPKPIEVDDQVPIL
jgi:hypothetical protein